MSSASQQTVRQENVSNRRKFKNKPKEISNFFFNLTKCLATAKGDAGLAGAKPAKGDHRRSKSGEATLGALRNDMNKNIPFQLLMGNFRRKRIIETLKKAQAGKISFDERQDIL